MVWHGYCRMSAPVSFTATACMARTSPRRATASTPTRWCSIRTPRPWRARCVGRRDVRLPGRRSRRRICRSTTRDNAALAPLAAVIDAAFTWGDDAPPRTPWHETLIYEVHVKGFTTAASGRPARRCAAPTPGWPSEAAIRHLKRARRHRRRADARASSCLRSASRRARA